MQLDSRVPEQLNYLVWDVFLDILMIDVDEPPLNDLRDYEKEDIEKIQIFMENSYKFEASLFSIYEVWKWYSVFMDADWMILQKDSDIVEQALKRVREQDSLKYDAHINFIVGMEIDVRGNHIEI